MKRSSCLSALLVGLSVTVASVASAEEPTKAPVKIAQARMQPSDPQPSGDQPTPPPAPSDQPAPAPSDQPAPAPAGEGESAPAPAIKLGGPTTPGSDTTTEEPKPAETKKKPPAWANSSLFATTSMTTATVFRGQQQDYNPTVDSALWFLPRYALSDDFQLRGRLIFNYEYTDSDTTVTRNEPRFSDTTVQLFYRGIPKFAGIKAQIFGQLGAPTSPESRARTLVVSPGAGFVLNRSFEHVAGGDLTLVTNFAYSHPLYRVQQAEVRGERPYAMQCAGGTNCQDLLSGTLNPSDILVYSGMVSMTWGKWTPALFYLGSSQWVYHPKDDARVPIAGGASTAAVAPSGFERSSVRQTAYFSAWLDYEATSWLTPEIGYWLSRAILTEDGKYGNVFWDRYQDMRVYIGANINVDALVQVMAGGGDGQAGILRAKNKSPVLHF